jgi:hypothetical protein|tara:strand:- start:2903 stop:3136 length:234 start_codon:yes stop_codon:yes gene_type:complete
MDETTMKLVKLGREMITQAEENKVFAKDDAKWNTCVVAGNRLTTIGTTWGLQSVKDLKTNEREVVLEFLDLNEGLLA